MKNISKLNGEITRSIFKKVNCRRLQSCGFFKYKNDSFQSSNFLLLRSMVRPISQRSKGQLKSECTNVSANKCNHEAKKA